MTDERLVVHKTKDSIKNRQSDDAPMKLPWKTTFDINSLTCEFADTLTLETSAKLFLSLKGKLLSCKGASMPFYIS